MRYVLCILLICLSFYKPAFSAQIRLAWDPNEEPDLAGYEVFWKEAPSDCKCTDSESFGEPEDTGNVTTYTLTGLNWAQRYCIALKAYNQSGKRSGPSNPVCGIAHDETYGEWVLDIKVGDKGGVVLRFDDIKETFSGYRISDKVKDLQDLRVSGSYTYNDKKGIIDPHSEKRIGGLDKSRTTMTFRLNNLSMKGPIFLRDPLNPQYPDIPKDWSFHIKKGLVNPTIDQVVRTSVEPLLVDGEQSHLFTFEPEDPDNPGPLTLRGEFLVTSNNKVYGYYEIVIGSLSDKGFLLGNLSGTERLTEFEAKDSKKGYTFSGQSKL